VLVSAEFFYDHITQSSNDDSHSIIYDEENNFFFLSLSLQFFSCCTSYISHCCVINIIHEISLQGQEIFFIQLINIFIHNGIYVACSFQIFCVQSYLFLCQLCRTYIKIENMKMFLPVSSFACCFLKGQHWKVLKKWNLIWTKKYIKNFFTSCSSSYISSCTHLLHRSFHSSFLLLFTLLKKI